MSHNTVRASPIYNITPCGSQIRQMLFSAPEASITASQIALPGIDTVLESARTPDNGEEENLTEAAESDKKPNTWQRFKRRIIGAFRANRATNEESESDQTKSTPSCTSGTPSTDEGSSKDPGDEQESDTAVEPENNAETESEREHDMAETMDGFQSGSPFSSSSTCTSAESIISQYLDQETIATVKCRCRYIRNEADDEDIDRLIYELQNPSPSLLLLDYTDPQGYMTAGSGYYSSDRSAETEDSEVEDAENSDFEETESSDAQEAEYSEFEDGEDLEAEVPYSPNIRPEETHTIPPRVSTYKFTPICMNPIPPRKPLLYPTITGP